MSEVKAGADLWRGWTKYFFLIKDTVIIYTNIRNEYCFHNFRFKGARSFYTLRYQRQRGEGLNLIFEQKKESFRCRVL